MKTFAKIILVVSVWPLALLMRPCFALAVLVLGRDRAAAGLSQRVARAPGVFGDYLRRAVLGYGLARVGRDAVISFGTIFSKASAEVGDRVYLGAYGVFGDVRIGDDTLIGDHVCIPSGAAQHGIERLDVPIREQAGEYRAVRIGCDCWIGSGAIVLADVGDHAVVAAASVVTHPVEPYKIVAGNPAREVGDRRDREPATRDA